MIVSLVGYVGLVSAILASSSADAQATFQTVSNVEVETVTSPSYGFVYQEWSLVGIVNGKRVHIQGSPLRDLDASLPRAGQICDLTLANGLHFETGNMLTAPDAELAIVNFACREASPAK